MRISPLLPATTTSVRSSVQSAAMLVLLAGSLSLLGLTGGCLSKSELPPPRYFRPGPVVPPAQTATELAPDAAAALRLLRLREVTAAAHLHERMVWAQPDGEYGFYEDARWTEPPSAYMEAALAQALFEQGRFRRANASDAPVLDVHVTAFEEVIGTDGSQGQHGARVAIRVVLTTRDGQALLERTLSVTRPLSASSVDAAALAQAMGQALNEVVNATAVAVLGAYPPS